MAAISPGTVSAAESVPGSLAPPDRMLNKDLARRTRVRIKITAAPVSWFSACG
jgi:hypothetical protein